MSKRSGAASSAASKKSRDEGAAIVERGNHILFWRTEAYASQWHPAPFEEQGTRFVNCEQYMMYGKAKLFGDDEIAAKVLTTTDPREQKRLGRAVKNFDEDIWLANREKIVQQGNYLKFSQNPELREKLLASGDKKYVEASPVDRIWGIGLAASNPACDNESTWKGLNLLGKAIDVARDRIRSEMAAAAGGAAAGK